MQEYIGKVLLDDSAWPGEDLYSDGEIEERLLEIAKNTPEDKLNGVIAAEADWAVLYHLSHIRENIVSPLPIEKTQTVLEIGSGCGAITGELARKAGHVTCIDLSRRRSQINAYRHKDMENIDIRLGNFQDVEKTLTEKYDWITLIGVFEYGALYIGTDSPYTEFLNMIKSHLAPGGKIVIAIENRLGLKYWAGAREDHTGRLFDGLENYPKGGSARTFSRPELEKIFSACGMEAAEFFYPYPDYKLPLEVYSDDRLPVAGELNTNIWNFDRERLVLFNEEAVFNSLIEGGEFPLFSNSYLVILQEKAEQTEEEKIIYSRFSNERRREFSIRTDIVRRPDGTEFVRKCAAYPEGQPHIEKLKKRSARLAQILDGTKIRVNRLVSETAKDAEFEYLSGGHTLQEDLMSLWNNAQREDALKDLHQIMDIIEDKAQDEFRITSEFSFIFGLKSWPLKAAKSMEVTDIDMVAGNILIEEGSDDWNLIDCEWTFDFPVPVRYVMFRTLHYFIENVLRGEATESYYKEAGFEEDELEVYSRMEASFQAFVTGGHIPAREMFASITPGTRDVKEEMSLGGAGGDMSLQSTVYYGPDDQFTQKRAVHKQLKLKADGHFEFAINMEEIGHPKFIRWDPMERHMIRIRVEEIEAQGPLSLRAGCGVDRDGFTEMWTTDPALFITGEHLEKNDRIVLKGTIQFMNPGERMPDMYQSYLERNAFEAELENVRARLAAQQSTKAFRGIEKIRSIRNYIKARMMMIPGLRIKTVVDDRYNNWYSENKTDEKMLAMQRMTRLRVQPKFSILVPVFNTPENYLREMIDSVIAQTYPNWELCIADASIDAQGNHNEKVAQILQEYALSDNRIRVKALTQNTGISGNTNEAAAMATGDYIALLDHDDLLAPDALFEVAGRISLTGADMVYTDEDKVSMDGKVHFDPNLKPDFSPDLLCSHNYITHFLAVRLDLFMAAGGFDSECDGAQDYDLIFKCSEQASRIEHVPKVLYHWRMHRGSTAENPESKLYAYEAGKRAIEKHLERTGESGHVEIMKEYWGMNHVTYDTAGDPLVSIVIPNKDHTDDLDRCIRSIMDGSDYRAFEIIVVENNSEEAKTEEYYKKITAEYPQVKVVRYEGEFNYSKINNFGVRSSKGAYLLLLNNDTKLIAAESIREMLGLCMKKGTGCVGAKLLYEDGTVQHAGVVLGFGGYAGHVFHGIKKENLGFMCRAQITGNYSAVTAACLMVSRSIYDEVGGFSEDLAVACNDVDFCLKVQAKGYYNVFTPFSLWYHFESKSRGYEDTPEKKARFEKEVAVFRSRWGETVDAGDPYYNANFSVQREPFTLY